MQLTVEELPTSAILGRFGPAAGHVQDGCSSLLYKARGRFGKPPMHPRQATNSLDGAPFYPSAVESGSVAGAGLHGPGLDPPVASGPVLSMPGEVAFGPFDASSAKGLDHWLGGLVLPSGMTEKVARVDDLCASVGACLSYQADDVALGSHYFRAIIAKWQGELIGMSTCTATLVTRAVAALSVNLAAKLLGNRFFSVPGLMQAVYGRQLQPGYALRLELSCLDALEWRVAPGCLLQRHEWDSAEATNADFESRPPPLASSPYPPGPGHPSQAAAQASAQDYCFQSQTGPVPFGGPGYVYGHLPGGAAPHPGQACFAGETGSGGLLSLLERAA